MNQSLINIFATFAPIAIAALAIVSLNYKRHLTETRMELLKIKLTHSKISLLDYYTATELE